ncbi:tetratricopeptide repeat protein [Enhygromyxa salina]|uniref:tetratricopeptide repeat protein n=1 Tax=Enhygromyxa salina TaxID=215803 RepID=UPI0015E6287D|nr:tetratricopeptide repeat protein [Enhygromyxa salina]
MAYAGLADTARSAGDPRRALELYQQALDVGRGSLGPSELSAVRRKMGDAAEQISDHRGAEEHYRGALAETRVVDDVDEMARSYLGLATVALSGARFDEAVALAHEAVELSEARDLRGVAAGCRTLGLIEQTRGDAEAAARHEQALALARELDAGSR